MANNMEVGLDSHENWHPHADIELGKIWAAPLLRANNKHGLGLVKLAGSYMLGETLEQNKTVSKNLYMIQLHCLKGEQLLKKHIFLKPCANGLPLFTIAVNGIGNWTFYNGLKSCPGNSNIFGEKE